MANNEGIFYCFFFYFSNPLLYLCSKCIIQTSVNMGFFSFFSKEKKETLDKGLSKTKESVFSKIARAVAGKSKVDDEVLDNLEEVLITSIRAPGQQRPSKRVKFRIRPSMWWHLLKMKISAISQRISPLIRMLYLFI